MNLADSVKFVLKNKSQNIFSIFWKEDVSHLFQEARSDITHFNKSAFKRLKSFRYRGKVPSPREMVESAADAFLIFKVIPGRVKDGFSYFRNDLIEELERLPDQKQKTIFVLKVLGALSRFVVSAIYNFKIGKADFSYVGLRHKNAFTQFLIAELVFKISQIFVMRFLTEVEKHLSDPEELNNLRYFKALFSDRDKLESEKEVLDQTVVPDDRAISLVDELRKYVITGKRSTSTNS